MGEEIGRKKRREADRERNLWEEKRLKEVIVRVWEGKKNKTKRREEVRDFIMRKAEWVKENNIYKNYVLHERDCFPFFFFFEKQTIENN